MPAGRMVMSTDGYVISPLFFPGGDIGSLAVHGTINDIAMAGARPLHLAAGYIIEEGFPLVRPAADRAEHGARRARGGGGDRNGRYQGGGARQRRRRVHHDDGHRRWFRQASIFRPTARAQAIGSSSPGRSAIMAWP